MVTIMLIIPHIISIINIMVIIINTYHHDYYDLQRLAQGHEVRVAARRIGHARGALAGCAGGAL